MEEKNIKIIWHSAICFSLLLISISFSSLLNNFFNWPGWIGVSAIVLAGTFIFIAIQANANKKSAKYLEYQARPTAYFLLFRSYIYVKNTSNFLVKFYFRMSSDNKTLNGGRWEDDPLYIYPGAGYMRFPNAFKVDKLVDGKIKIEYRVAPSHINDSELRKNIQIIEWSYIKATEKWKAPNGIEEIGVLSFLPKRERYELIKQFQLVNEYPELAPTEAGQGNP